MDEFGKVGAETSYLQSQTHSDNDSAESVADSDLEDRESRKMLASLLKMQSRGDCKSSRIPTAPGKNLLQLYRREEQVQSVLKLITREEKALCQVHLRNREHRGNLLQCFHQEARNRETNSRVLFSNTLIRQIWDDLFLKAMKIICSVRQDLNE